MALTPKQLIFVNEYLRDLNATQAAIRAGYSKSTAHAIGWENLRKPEIKKHIDKKLQERTLSKDETVKLISDIGRGSLNDYFVIKRRLQTHLIEVPLAKVIDGIRIKIEDADKFIAKANVTSAKELKLHHGAQNERKREIVKLEIELERNPKATRIIDSEPYFVDAAELDMVKLVKDKELGKIKSVVPTEHGLKVEMFAADAALKDMARIHGAFEKDKEPPPTNNFNFNNLSPEELKSLLTIKRKLVT